MNMGNPYTYVGNAPGMYVDPYGFGVLSDIGNGLRGRDTHGNPPLPDVPLTEPYVPPAAVSPNEDLPAGYVEGDLGKGLYGRIVAGKNEGLQVAGSALLAGTMPLTGSIRIVVDGLYVMSDLSGDHPNYMGIGLTALGLRAVGREVLTANKAVEIESLGKAWARVKANDASGMICEMRSQKGFAFESMREFTRYWGSAGDGRSWHHIVEQNKLSQFGAEAIHNVQNIVSVPTSVNRKLNGYYQKKIMEITGDSSKSIREWLSGQSYKEQREFGLKALEMASKGMLP
jgi:hypothetical protein